MYRLKCNFCGIEKENSLATKWCKKCNAVCYCSDKHRKKDEKNHKIHCEVEIYNTQQKSYAILEKVLLSNKVNQVIASLLYQHSNEILLFAINNGKNNNDILCQISPYRKKSCTHTENEFFCLFMIEGYEDILHTMSFEKLKCKRAFELSGMKKLILPYGFNEIAEINVFDGLS